MTAPHQERMVTELAELTEKVSKLGYFLFGPTFNSLDLEEQRRMLKQYAYMKLYLEVLNERVKAI
jgi:hypothetical protein